jgi:hypothetical protein
MVDDRGVRKPSLEQLEAWGYGSAVSADGKWIYYGGLNGSPRFFDTASGEEAHFYDNPPVATGGGVFSPDGRTRACEEGPSVRLFEVATGKERHCLTGHIGGAGHLRFSADSRILVSAGGDTTALVWDLTGRRTGVVSDKPLTPAELDARWAALAGDDAAKAYDAIRSLAAAPSQAVPYLVRHLRPVKLADEKRVSGLIADLDGDQFAVRERAADELEKLDESAIAACRRALAGRPAAEARRRLEAILGKEADRLRNPTGNLLRNIRALEVLESIGDRPARQLLESLARGMLEARQTQEARATLDRLARREAAAGSGR